MTAASPADRNGRKPGLLALFIGLLGVLLLCMLGVWQVERLHWKEAVLREIAERTQAAPQGIDAIEAVHRQTGDVEYYPVRLRGSFLHASERFFISTFGGEAGWNVYTPLRLDGGRFVFVNRGYVPYDLKDPAKRRDGQVSGEVAVTGLARNAVTEKPSSILPANDTSKNQFFWKSIADMRIGSTVPPDATVLPFVVDAGPGRAPGGWPIGGTTIVDIPNNHLQYAITWFALALVLAVMLGFWVYRSRHPVEAARQG